MDDRLRQLRNRVRAQQRVQPTTAARYPQRLREEIVAVGREAQARGVAILRLARELSVVAQGEPSGVTHMGPVRRRDRTVTAGGEKIDVAGGGRSASA